jgi:hypothetical protein
MENYFAYMGRSVDKDRLLQVRLPEELWRRVETFLQRLAGLPCWIDSELSRVIFGAKQNRDVWKEIFRTGRAPNSAMVLAQPLDVNRMIQ